MDEDDRTGVCKVCLGFFRAGIIYSYLCRRIKGGETVVIMKNRKKKEKSEAGIMTGIPEKKRKLEVPLLWFIILHVSLLINSMAGVASKKAGQQKFLSLPFLVYYGLVLLITFAFALIWQQVLKNMSLTFAFTNKPITMVWGLIWGVIIFQEHVTWKMLLGSAIILIGIIIGVSGNEQSE